jgi:hypothetical protein
VADPSYFVPEVRGYWCRLCGMVRFDLLIPICRHGVPDPPLTMPPRIMDPLPSWHPLAR